MFGIHISKQFDLGNYSSITDAIDDVTHTYNLDICQIFLYGPQSRIQGKYNEDVLKKYTGTYEIADMHLTIDVTINDGVLIAQPARDGHPGPTSVMLPMNETHFYDQRDEEVEITFDIDVAKKVNGMKILQMGVTRYAKKIK